MEALIDFYQAAETKAILAFLMSLLLTYLFIPAIIRLAHIKKLYDKQDDRKKHTARISSLGGMGIFGGLLLSFVFFSAGLFHASLNSFLVGVLVLFITGVKDDLYPLTPIKKLLGQMLAVGVIVIQGNIRMETLYGFLGINELGYWQSILITVAYFILIINAFNFTDGINGLMGLMSFFFFSVYSIWFYYLGDYLHLLLSMSALGSVLAFLRYNFGNAKIFMGDNGSMVLGYISAILTIRFVQLNEHTPSVLLEHVDAFVFSISTVALPLVDAFRVMALRVLVYKKHPLSADRNHFHHYLIDNGVNAPLAASIVSVVSLGGMMMAFYLRNMVPSRYLLFIIFAYILLSIVLTRRWFRFKNKTQIHE